MKYRIMALLLTVVFLLVGCDSNSNNRTSSKKKDDSETESSQSAEKIPVEEIDLPALYDDTYQLPEDVFSFSDLESKQVESVAKFSYYYSRQDNGSFQYSILINRYRDHLVCTWQNLECGDIMCGSFLLDQEQGNAFLELVEDHAVTEEPESSDREGDWYSYYTLHYSDTTSYVKRLNLADLDLDIPDEMTEDAFWEDADELFSFSEEVEEKLGQWEDVSILAPWKYCSSVYQQILDCTGKKIKSATETESNELEIKLEIVLKGGKTMTVITTYTGQIVAYRYH